MTVFSVYLGELGVDGALDWGGEVVLGNTPTRIGPRFPSIDFSVWSRTRRIIRERWDGAQVDWGAFAARLGVEQIRWFLSDLYGDAVPEELTQFVATLDADRSYALVATES